MSNKEFRMMKFINSIVSFGVLHWLFDILRFVFELLRKEKPEANNLNKEDAENYQRHHHEWQRHVVPQRS